ncbi:hypothetical protein [Deinococcus geothermalis]|uniref:hypothetical protein n=1 Tax=Deinococcus geothermalis TaxID=68909 RepID=UPI0023574710|nr:hypothetical protein [Deinococcus geothermalis]
MDHLPREFISYLKEVQAAIGHEANAFRAARLLEISMKVGAENYVLTESDPPVMHLQPWFYGWNNDVIRHEMAHIILAWSRVEAHLIRDFGSREAALPMIENLCNQALAFLQITQPMVNAAVKRHGVSAQAVRHLMRLSGAHADRALHRLIQDDPDAARSGFVTSGKYIGQVSYCNLPLPFWLFERVPEPALRFPPDTNATFSRIPNTHNLIGVCWG